MSAGSVGQNPFDMCIDPSDRHQVIKHKLDYCLRQLREEGLCFGCKPSVVDPTGVVSSRQIAHSRLEAARYQRLEAFAAARDNRDHAFHDRDVVLFGNGLVEYRLNQRFVLDCGETPLPSKSPEMATHTQVTGDGPIIDDGIAAFVEPLQKSRQEIEYIIIRPQEKALRDLRFLLGEKSQEL